MKSACFCCAGFCISSCGAVGTCDAVYLKFKFNRVELKFILDIRVRHRKYRIVDDMKYDTNKCDLVIDYHPWNNNDFFSTASSENKEEEKRLVEVLSSGKFKCDVSAERGPT